ncbi:MAG: UDP-N-acetylmuramate--L-alanine ligase [Candidatus Omnitrophica bacterium]|nr:UDP-N-acetylmuramate--L-alanine ligase [Candidatus Omnitrophota bacterium]
MQKHYHLIGIGGIGMSGIAKLLLQRDIKVSGSDLKETRLTEELRNLGAKIFIGHNPNNIKGADVIIYSSAIKPDNPEIQEAKRLGLPLVKRAQALAQLMEDKVVITVTGSHGKTTTASLISYLLLEADLFPTVAIGGILKNINNNVSLGKGDFFVAEADESDSSFLYYRPKYSVITNIDYEHLDYYKEFENLVFSFKEFIERTSSDGCVFACADDINLRKLLMDYKKRYVLFGLNPPADIYPKNIRIKGLSSEFDCFFKDRFAGRFSLALGGMHNISNALAVIALGFELGIDLTIVKKVLKDYKGSQRRIEIKFNEKDFLVIDDYAHHPTEIKATLAALRNINPKRLIAIFQPHRYTRTNLLAEEFVASFDLVDYLIITDIYPAGEDPIDGVTATLIYDKIRPRLKDKPVYLLEKEKIIEHILKIIRPYDLVVTLGAGDIGKINDELVEALKRKD